MRIESFEDYEAEDNDYVEDAADIIAEMPIDIALEILADFEVMDELAL